MSGEKKDKETVLINNIKNSNYRQIHVDGALGGVTPTGKININFFAQRNAIPKATEYQIEGVSLLKAVRNSAESLEGIVREFEFGVYMDIDTCTSLRDFLNKKIEEHKKIISEVNKSKK